MLGTHHSLNSLLPQLAFMRQHSNTRRLMSSSVLQILQVLSSPTCLTLSNSLTCWRPWHTLHVKCLIFSIILNSCIYFHRASSFHLNMKILVWIEFHTKAGPCNFSFPEDPSILPCFNIFFHHISYNTVPRSLSSYSASM